MSPSPLLRIPQELLLQILVLLPLDDQITVIKVCSAFRNLILYDPLLRNTRYAIDSGATRVTGSLNPSPLQDPRFPVPNTHKILGPRSVHPFAKLICTSVGENITRYAYRRCYDGEPQRGMIIERIYNDPPTPEEAEAEKDTVIIALTLGIYRFKIQDITDSPFLDEPFLQPAVEDMASTGLEGHNYILDTEEEYVTVECQVVVHRNFFLYDTPDPSDWEERLKITKNTTVRQLTAILMKVAFRKLGDTGLEPDATAENVIRFWRLWSQNKWIFSLIHYRTSEETRNMVWALESNHLGDYKVSRRIL
ncbi:uncharacterized protein DFL_005617 [Arthrobotrys flagrans]|uniref:F-box domain-containing protein n=1 Tax=Arthrobotrys flagrans TaxID=97331 RepID=A0A436ZYP9_ARTFL|nr:hypothetical protein DFL_005617 [Arthrobotrys flagrans]